MKKLTELLTISQPECEGTLSIAAEQGRKTQTLSAGCETKDLNVPTTHRSLTPDQTEDILLKLSTLKPWQMQQDADPQDLTSALRLLELALIPATLEDCMYWLTRLLAHFPRRDVSSDAVVISDLSADLLEAGVSNLALAGACVDIRRTATKKDPWLPPSGHILKKAKERTESFHLQHNRLKFPQMQRAIEVAKVATDTCPWWRFKWNDMPDKERLELYQFVKALDMPIGKTYCRGTDIDYDILMGWGEAHG